MKKVVLCALAIVLLALTACGGLPTLKEGERYFAGDIDFEYAKECSLSLVLSADGKSVSSVQLQMKSFSFRKEYNGKTYSGSSGVVGSYGSGGKLDDSGNVSFSLNNGNVKLNIKDGKATGELTYTHEVKESSGNKTVLVPLGTFPFELQDKTDELLAKQAEKK